MKYLYPILIIILFSCGNETNNSQVKNSKTINSSSKILFDVNAQMKNGIFLSRVIDTNLLKKDTIMYIMDDYGVYNYNRENFNYYVKFSIFDIDFKNIYIRDNDSIFGVKFTCKDEKKMIEWGKIKNENGNLVKGWFEYSDYIYLNFPVNSEMLNEKFKYYHAFSYDNDIINCEYLSINSNEMIKDKLRKGINLYFKFMDTVLDKRIIEVSENIEFPAD